jgi:uncharacterized membrane protein YuzA (DUF378 family)
VVGLSGLWQLVPFFRSIRVSEVDAEAHRTPRAPAG